MFRLWNLSEMSHISTPYPASSGLGVEAYDISDYNET